MNLYLISVVALPSTVAQTALVMVCVRVGVCTQVGSVTLQLTSEVIRLYSSVRICGSVGWVTAAAPTRLAAHRLVLTIAPALMEIIHQMNNHVRAATLPRKTKVLRREHVPIQPNPSFMATPYRTSLSSQKRFQ